MAITRKGGGLIDDSANGYQATAVFVVQQDDLTTAAVDADTETVGADGASNTSSRMAVASRLVVFNGTTWDRGRSGDVTTDTAGSTGVLGAIVYMSDGAARRRLFNAAATADANAATNILAVASSHFNGLTWDRERMPNVFKVVALGAGTTETTIWTPAAGKKFRLMGFLLTVGAASTLTFKDNTAGTTIFAARGTTDTPIISPPMRNGILSAVANNVLTVTRGTSATLDGVVFGTEE